MLFQRRAMGRGGAEGEELVCARAKDFDYDSYEPWISSAQLLKKYPISKAKLDRLIKGNPPLPHRRAGKTYMFRLSDVDRFLDKYGLALVDTQKDYTKKD